MEKKMKIFSFDAETNGLYGEAFAIGAAVTLGEREVSRFVGRCPIIGEVDEWVRKNVLPNIRDIEETSKSYVDLLSDFWGFYKSNKEGADIIAHVAHPVETKLLRDMVEQDLQSRMWDGPFPLIDVAGVLRARGEDPNSVDKYIEKHDLRVGFDGSTHHPLYDSFAAEVVYRHLMENVEEGK